MFPFKKWHNEWIARIKQNKKTDNLSLDSSTLNLMRSSNPLVIPRNHKVEEVLDAANNNNLVPLHNFLKVLKKPYERPYKKEEYHITPPQNGKEYKTFTGLPLCNPGDILGNLEITRVASSDNSG